MSEADVQYEGSMSRLSRGFCVPGHVHRNACSCDVQHASSDSWNCDEVVLRAPKARRPLHQSDTQRRFSQIATPPHSIILCTCPKLQVVYPSVLMPQSSSGLIVLHTNFQYAVRSFHNDSRVGPCEVFLPQSLFIHSICAVHFSW